MYLFRNPRLYFDCIKWMIIVLSLYFGLWLTNFLSVSLEVRILLLYHHTTYYYWYWYKCVYDVVIVCVLNVLLLICLYYSIYMYFISYILATQVSELGVAVSVPSCGQCVLLLLYRQGQLTSIFVRIDVYLAHSHTFTSMTCLILTQFVYIHMLV